MAKLLTTFDPTNPTSGNFVATFNTGCGTLHIKNASAVDVGFSLAQAGYVQWVVQAGEPRDIPIPMSKANVYWSQQNKLNTNTKQMQSVVYVESYEKGETIPASQALPRHNNQVNIGYIMNVQSAGVNTGPTSGFNLFNPTNSGVVAIFYSLEIGMDTTNTTNLSPAIWNTAGADLAFGFIQAPINSIPGGPTSQMKGSWNTNFNPSLGTKLKQVSFQNGNYDFCRAPQQRQLNPGQNMSLVIVNPSSVVGAILSGSLEWTENPQ